MAKSPSSPPEETPPDASGPETSEPETAAPGGTRIFRAVIGIAVLAAIVGGLIWAKANGFIPANETQDPAVARLEQRFADLETRLALVEDGQAVAQTDAEEEQRTVADGIAALEARIATIEARPAAVTTTAVPANLSPLEDRLAALEEALAEAETQQSSGEEARRDLEDRIAALEERPQYPEPVADTAAPAAATLLIVAQLRAALVGSGPYDAPLAALRALGGDDPAVTAALDVLAPHAASGVPTVARLRDRFAALADDISRGSADPATGSWISRTFARLSGLVTVRPVGGDVAGDRPKAVVARAEALLAADDLAAAVAEVAALDGAPAAVAAPWLADAQARLAVDGAVAALEARAVAAMAKF